MFVGGRTINVKEVIFNYVSERHKPKTLLPKKKSLGSTLVVRRETDR